MLGLLSGDAGPKAMVPTMSPFFRLGSSKKYRVFDLFVIRNEGLLVCSNVHVSGEFSIFGKAFSTAF